MADVNDLIKEINNTPDRTIEYSIEDIEKNKLMGVLAYLNVLVLIPILAAKDSPYARFHSNQGLVLAICEILVSTVGGILGRLPLIGWLFKLAFGVVGLVFLVLSIKAIIEVFNGQAKELPVLGNIQLLK